MKITSASTRTSSMPGASRSCTSKWLSATTSARWSKTWATRQARCWKPLTRSSKRRSAATSSTGAAASKVEPLRSIAGQLNGNTVNGDFVGNGRPVPFTFTFKRADMVGDQVVVSGDFQIGGRLSQKLQSRLVATMATADNPWPSARDEAPKEKPKEKPKAQSGEQKQGRESRNPETTAQLGELAQATQDTARKTPPAPGERNEQTQSLYAQAAEGIGCGAV